MQDETILEPDRELPEEGAADADSSPLERERDEYREGWQRAKADLINYKRQESERVAHAISVGLGQAVEDLLLVLDSFDIALATLQGDPAAEQGMRMIKSQLLEVLKRYGLEQLPGADLVGKQLDPATSEAIGTQEREGVEEGTVVAVAQDGYRMGGRVLRPARVYTAAKKS